MARLLDLPAEVILSIYEYLQMDTKQTPLLFYEYGDAYRYVKDRDPPPSVKNLHSFLLASDRLHGRFIQAMFYRDVFVPSRDYLRRNCAKNTPLQQLDRTLKDDPSRQEHIISATIPCEDSVDFRQFFWFNNIRNLTIIDSYDGHWDPLKFEDDSHIGTSPVECLRLISCEADEEALTTIFSWPAALKKVHYDVEQSAWGCNCGDCGLPPWSCAAFVRPLQSQKASLEELTMTRPPLVHGGLGDGPHIDLSEFTALKTLRIYHVFLCGWGHYSLWESLPRSLEVLEVYYDDLQITDYLSGADQGLGGHFIPDLIKHKRSHFPHLHTMIIHSSEGVPEPETDMGWTIGLWTVPPLLAQECDEAGVKLNVWLGSRERLKFDEEDDILQSLKRSQSKHPIPPSNKVAAPNNYISD
ncbi:hypothetical protein N7447_006943 [Penicillium robsamsonii]|uniref:uncharacterized protein n=1 Tax=Penicillium robsamsonii TaxID=1792511 RepID=UPI0025485884|nr:uncharacterized protein N7447_006943 [Penicillium robsamsonii]KAJ5824603.1 hypothetical protein N7447_006943 [Penicillium robsamsonii]